MDVDSSFQSLLHNLKIDSPWTLPKTWELISSESGTTTLPAPVQRPQDTMYDLPSVSEACLLRLVINALQGVRSAIIEIDKLSFLFCLSPSDRSVHRVPSLWCRLSSSYALGGMLKSINHSGLLFFFLREFVSYFLCTDRNANSVRRDKNDNCSIPSNHEQDNNERKEFPPYSLINQAFAVAIGKLLEGYICALNTLSTSIRLRRSVQCKGDSMPINHIEGTLTSVVYTEMTIMEVYLHTKELRSHIEALGSICFCHPFCQTLGSDALNLNSVMEFHMFPRGADLLSYLYVQFRDADLIHHSLLKYLFFHSYEPYSGFIKLWMYKATIDDPYGEFFVASSDITTPIDSGFPSLDKFSLASMKELSGVSVPCFLSDICHPLFQAGQQLQVLVKLLDCCDLSFSGEYAPCDLPTLREILPFWVDSSNNLDFLSNPLSFDINDMEALIQKREIMYRTMLEKLEDYFDKFCAKNRTSQNVVDLGSVPILLGGSSINLSLFDRESSIIHGSPNESCSDADSDTSSSSTESAFQTELSLLSECSTHDYNDGTIDKCLFDLQGNLCQLSKSLFLRLPSDHAKKSVLQTYTETDQQYFCPPSFHTSVEHVYPMTSFSHHHHQKRKMNQILLSSKSEARDLKTSKQSSEICQSGGCWPLGGLQSNPFCTYMKCTGIEPCYENDEGYSDEFSGDEISFSDVFGSVILNFDVSERVQTSSCTFKSLSCHSSTISYPYAFSMNPMLTRTSWLPTACNSRDSSFINASASHFPNFNFSSVSDPCKLHSESLPLGSGYKSKAEASMSVQRDGSGGPEHCSCPFIETTENQPISASLCYSVEETNSQKSVQLLNASGGADWAGLLKYPVKSATYKHGITHSEEKFLVPLDIILDKCIIQEILLQCKYISCFTIKFLEEGFKLHEHLLALRRYHFMEISDWADLFVMSLSSQSALEDEPARLQGFLHLALQRSSCKSDPYKERLFICTREQTCPQASFANGINAFDFMVLGYRVDWPVNIVVTQTSLKVYADIFSYLLQIRLAGTSLTDVWHYLKDLLHFLKRDQHRTFLEMEDLNTLMRIRQHINHFATTLRQYVQSQLDASWNLFQDSLKHMVKYLLDLEPVHMLYLTDAVRLCFLADDAKEVAPIIKNILQCALDFRLCFADINFTGRLYGNDKSYLRSQINFTQVSVVNNTFEKNLKGLYHLYLKWQNHSELNLNGLWNNLNYNDYFSTIINK